MKPWTKDVSYSCPCHCDAVEDAENEKKKKKTEGNSAKSVVGKAADVDAIVHIVRHVAMLLCALALCLNVVTMSVIQPIIYGT